MYNDATSQGSRSSPQKTLNPKIRYRMLPESSICPKAKRLRAAIVTFGVAISVCEKAEHPTGSSIFRIGLYRD